MDMGVDTTRQHPAVTGIQNLPIGLKPPADGNDGPILNVDVNLFEIVFARQGYQTVLDQQVLSHHSSSELIAFRTRSGVKGASYNLTPMAS